MRDDVPRPPDIGETQKDDPTWFGIGIAILVIWVAVMVAIVMNA